MKEQIKIWIENNKLEELMELPKNENFINFLLTLYPTINKSKAEFDSRKCVEAYGKDDLDSICGCIDIRLKNSNTF